MATIQFQNTRYKNSMKDLSKYIQRLEKNKREIVRKFENDLNVKQDNKELYNTVKDPRK